MTCNHIIQCAVTEDQRERATEMIRSGEHPIVIVGMAMLNGPCTDAKESE